MNFKSNYLTSSLIISVICLITFRSLGQVSAKLICNQVEGWMPDGWGTYSINVTNTTQSDTILLKDWSLQWGSNEDKALNKINKVLLPGEVWKKNQTGYLPQSVVGRAGKNTPVMRGILTLAIGNKEENIPIKLSVPAAYLPEKTQIIRKGNVGIELMKSRLKKFKSHVKALNWLNESYQAMKELVGGVPYGGRMIIYKESPDNPYFAYAGREIILNTKFVGGSLREFDDGLLPFGWIHEMGHDFDDSIGQWYNWSGPAAEWQGNFKLCYVFEKIEDQSFKIKQTVAVPDYPMQEKGRILAGGVFVDKSFLFFGDKYLSDNSRSWKTLASDEINSLFLRIQHMYGWSVFKGWYRMYRKLNEQGFVAPESSEDKINLIVAILSKEAKVDLIPLFQTWRFPVSKEKVNAIKKMYHLN